jgi:hypothetical protein
LFTLLSAGTLPLSRLRTLSAFLMLLILTILALWLVTSLILTGLILPWLRALLALLILLSA